MIMMLKHIYLSLNIIAAIKYSGYSNNKKEENYRQELVKILQNSNLKTLSEHFVLSYDVQQNSTIGEMKY